MLTQRKRLGSASEIMEKKRENTGKGVAASYVRLIIEKKGEDRHKAANELHLYLIGRFREESSEFQQDFVNYFDSKGDNSMPNPIYELMNAKEDRNDRETSREAAILLIVVLAETMISIEGGKRVLRFAHHLLKVLMKLDEPGMELAARGLSYLIQTSKVYAAELVEKCLDESFEWVLSGNCENAPLASSILLRELALYTSTSFFLRAESYFTSIFQVMRSPKVRVRVAAAASLHESLSVISQREARGKRKWYYTCYQEAIGSVVDGEKNGLSRDERFHSMLLTLNELLRIADASIERERIRAVQIIRGTRHNLKWGSALESIVGERLVSNVVESRTAARLVQENIGTIWERCMETRSSKQSFVLAALIQIVPRLSPWLTPSQSQTAIETLLPLLAKYGEAQLSLGLVILYDPNRAKKYIPAILSFVKDSLHSFKRKKHEVSSHSHIFILLTLIVRSYGREVSMEMKDLLPLLLNFPLCNGLMAVFHEMYSHNEHWRSEVINGVLHQLSIILMGESIMGKSIHSFKSYPSIKMDVSHDSLDRYDLAMRALGEFDFPRTHLHLFIQYISEGYLVCDSLPLRLSAVKCCVAMLRPLMGDYERVSCQQRVPILSFIQSILKCLLRVSLVDSDVSVRLCVLGELSLANSTLLSLLSQPHLLEFLRLSLKDDSLEMREATLSLLSKIGMLNPSLVFPRLRRVLLETIGQLTNSRDAKVEEHSARLISHMAIQCPKLMRPYLGSLMEAFIPKLKKEYRYVDCTVHILATISELSLVGGSELVDSLPTLFPLLISFITDNSSLARREVALRAMCHLSASTTFSVDVYREYPHLLSLLLSLMKTEMSQSTRRLTMRVLGTLGAIDPYTYKAFCGQVLSEHNGLSSGLSLPTSDRVLDSRQDSMELLNYGRCTLDEFFSWITMANLISMLENDQFHNNYEEITHDLVTILRTLGSDSPSSMSKVIPQLIRITKNSKKERKEFFLTQLASLLSILDSQSSNHLDQVFSLIANVYKEDSFNYQHTIIRVIDIIASSVQSNMGPYVSEVVPYLLDGMKRDRFTDFKLISRCLSSVCAMRGSLSSHLHLIIPPVISLVDDASASIVLRKEAIQTLLMIGEKEDLSDYSPSIMQVWTKVICIRDLQAPSLNLLRLMIACKWKHLDVFQRSIESSLLANSIDSSEYNEYVRENGEWMRWRGNSWREGGDEDGSRQGVSHRPRSLSQHS
ncbi:hypothetical protein PMAYCL1PPCAC_23775 [Pristionchus mayeri]|uniref:Serine/threonine-protein kinase TOR n=1 Tax=Pristionchus mayeri TaxID=1317129 RepID=A0AAN5I719_9BILA|nr:hypothetical protein PMAYCL1PPCAC_23775 [Pristionchus mayeri]